MNPDPTPRQGEEMPTDDSIPQNRHERRALKAQMRKQNKQHKKNPAFTKATKEINKVIKDGMAQLRA
jgi:hypothetical protein